ncbi:hypothetical protein A4H97_30495 [Niastella yeongjuensis]|uniref:Uncharacterized protein n=1 Tax=Niastella yeongjuensis TaxID=354355 RepID=A0A1V9EP89_9BACT|nr:hypothetical protein [Niastella yeongjuensis]OQP47936.1 hypothetical protein A4H97_30495 [Niastella yeongjuensis]SEP48062.1 hypothetical protein SAMN05660816_06697 [Niastella yeongjuensis]
MSHPKQKSASQIGAPISAQEYQQLTTNFAQRYPNQTPSVFLSREHLLNTIEGVSDLSGILFAYGLNDANDPSTRRIILVPARNLTNGESGGIPVIPSKGYICENGERIRFDQFMQLLGNHVSDFKKVKEEIPLTKLPRGYFWGINKLKKLLEVDQCGGLVFHFGYNPEMRAACRQFQCVLEVVDGDNKSLNMFLEYGQCSPPCDIDPNGPGVTTTGSDCIASIAAERFVKDAEDKLNELRAFRDNWLVAQENGQALYEMYYYLSRPLVAEIQTRADQEAIWYDIYHNGISNCLDLIRENRNEEAKVSYVSMMKDLAHRFLGQEVTIEA